MIEIARFPVKALANMIGTRALARVLTEPATAASIANWSKELRQALVAPHANSPDNVRTAAEQLAQALAQEHGIDAAPLAAQLGLFHGGLFGPTPQQ